MRHARILVSDVLDGLAQLPDESAQCVITSPPYWGLRDYGCEGQIGLENTPEEYICRNRTESYLRGHGRETNSRQRAAFEHHRGVHRGCTYFKRKGGNLAKNGSFLVNCGPKTGNLGPRNLLSLNYEFS